MDLKEIIKLGTSLGHVDTGLKEFVTDQQNRIRDERFKEREMQKENNRLKLELEQIQSKKEEESNNMTRERLEHEREMARIQAGVIGSQQSNLVRVEKPRLPVYDGKEDISSYIVRFERVCTLIGIDPETYAVRLGTLLTGKAAELYSSLSLETTGNYDLLKKSLLLGFNKTPDSYRQEFRTLKRTTETYAQFKTELSRKLEYWLKCSNIKENYLDLKSFMLFDQFLASLPMELRVFLKERGTLHIDDAVKLSDNWLSAHQIKSYRPNNWRKLHSLEEDDRKVQNHERYGGDGDPRGITCYSCGTKGHIKSRCPTLFQPKDSNNSGAAPIYKVAYDFNNKIPQKYMSHGTINGANVSTVVRDTGCGCVVVSDNVVPHAQLSKAKVVKLADYLGRTNSFPIFKCYLRCDFYTGWVEAVVAPLRCCSVLLGNIPGVKDPTDSDKSSRVPGIKDDPNTNPKDCVIDALAVTRKQSAMEARSLSHPLITKNAKFLDITPEEFKTLQKECPTLKNLWNKAEKGEQVKLRDGSQFVFKIDNQLLNRVCLHSPNPKIIGRSSIVLPKPCRSFVLKTAHECPISGHFSHTKTYGKIAEHFFWPGASTDIKNHCRSCDICQKMSLKKAPPVPVMKMPIVDIPFSRVSMDIIGPLNPTSAGGHRYVLTLIDWTTGFPEAVPMKRTDSINVAEALLSIFSRVGIPKEILSDQGSNFISKLMGDLHQLLGVKPLFSSVYHAQGNGRVERLHLTLKSCLRKLCIDKPEDWHRYLTAVLFALRELPCERTGMSPFELLYGRKIRGPISVLREIWSDTSVSVGERDCYQYIIDLRQRLESCIKIAMEKTKHSQSKFSTYFDLKAKDRQLEVGDEALILLPDSNNKLLVCWRGPYKVVKRVNKVNYVLQCGGNQKTYHINLLKKYFRRNDESNSKIDESIPIGSYVPINILFIAHTPIIDEQYLDIEPPKREIVLNKELCIEHCTTSSDASKSPIISDCLDSGKREEVLKLATKFKETFSDIPGHTTTVTHKIELKSSEPVCSRVYPVPVHLREVFDEEVDKLLDMGIIERSTSNYRSPVVIVMKPDGSPRLTVDFRHLNSFSKLDSEPAFNPDDDIHRFYGSVYFSELDICKAYHQVELHKTSRHLTAFPTHRGLMEYKRLPFGLNSACATYARLMRIVLSGVEGVTYYFDNIMIYSPNWEKHMQTLNDVLFRLKSHGLTARPDKCFIGFNTINYLGFTISKDSIKPLQAKVECIAKTSPPRSKKGLRSFLGLLSFYRRFVLNLASITAPLTQLLKNKSPEPLSYNPEQSKSFEIAKQKMMSEPILKLPNLTLPFVVRTDASGVGIGGMLIQYYDDMPHPISYASRQLTDAERKYSTVERECLAIIFSMQRFSVYLTGKEFVLEVDHRPLVYLNKMKNLNSRLARWALCLQPFNYSVVYLPGVNNVGADYLSRNC